MRQELYDALKFLAQIVFPALGALYAALAGIWGWGYAEAVVGTVAAVDTFLGAVLMIDSRRYFADKKIVGKHEEGN